MFHCHVLDHADGGLMGTVEVGTGAGVGPHSAPHTEERCIRVSESEDLGVAPGELLDDAAERGRSVGGSQGEIPSADADGSAARPGPRQTATGRRARAVQMRPSSQ